MLAVPTPAAKLPDPEAVSFIILSFFLLLYHYFYKFNAHSFCYPCRRQPGPCLFATEIYSKRVRLITEVNTYKNDISNEILKLRFNVSI